jgi:hypothetical protein
MEENAPSLSTLRSWRYSKRAKDSKSGITHGRLWEKNGVIHQINCKGHCTAGCVRNRQHTLRITSAFAAGLKAKPGRKKRYSSRVPGPTPDESFVQPGQRANGLPHQLRREMCLLFAMSDERIAAMLESFMDYKPSKGLVSVGVVMPSLQRAVEELYQRMMSINPELKFHPALRRRWAPAVCRLMEMRWALIHEE